jgi:hypothetical protein
MLLHYDTIPYVRILNNTYYKVHIKAIKATEVTKYIRRKY